MEGNGRKYNVCERRGGRGGGARRPRRARGRGGRVKTVGGGHLGPACGRPSASDSVFCGLIGDLQEGQPIERPLHVKKSRVLLRKQTRPKPVSSVSTISATLASTSKRCLTPSSSFSNIPRKSPLRDKNINNQLHYGSESDSSSGEEDEATGREPVLVPRAARIFLSADDDDEVQPSVTNSVVDFEWPPQSGSTASQPEAVPEQDSSSPPETSLETSLEIQPLNKFEFNWKGFPNSQVPPELRREHFSEINCGPTVPLVSPYQAFTAIWDHNIMEHIATETNRYAHQLTTEMQKDGSIRPRSRITKWQDTTVAELYVFFGIIFATGIVVKSRIEEYWSKDKNIFSTPGFKAAMGIDRYLLLNKCLHFANNDDCNPETMARPEAKLFKIKPIIDHLNIKFQSLYKMSRNIALDESLTMWKGWLDINQFIHNKAAAVGIKTHEVCESDSGYLWRFEVLVGHSATSDPENPVSGTIPALVLRLLHGLEHKGHTVWMDNFYNSPALARELKVRGFDCVGTLRTNRQFVPVELSSLNKQDMAVGQVCGCTSGDVDIVVWRDKNRVALISTYHGLATTKCGDTLKPTIIPDYNICMRGVDRKDQMIAMYPIERKRCRVWYKKLFRRLLNASVLNAYRLLTTQQPMTHRNFRHNLITELLNKHGTHTSYPPPLPPAAGHFPAQYNFLAGKAHERQRRPCKVCKHRTTAYCRACNVPLCVFTCFEAHHVSH